jgi:transposase
MGRGNLTDQQWQQLQPLLPHQKPTTGRPAKDHRTIINGILWVLRTGAPWRDLPECYGPWPTVASQFYRWRQESRWERLLASVQQQSNIRGKVNTGSSARCQS